MEVLTLMTKAREQVKTSEILGLVNTSLWLAYSCQKCGDKGQAKTLIILWQGCIIIHCHCCHAIYQILWKDNSIYRDRHIVLGDFQQFVVYPITSEECNAIPGLVASFLESSPFDDWDESDDQMGPKFVAYQRTEDIETLRRWHSEALETVYNQQRRIEELEQRVTELEAVQS